MAGGMSRAVGQSLSTAFLGGALHSRQGGSSSRILTQRVQSRALPQVSRRVALILSTTVGSALLGSSPAEAAGAPSASGAAAAEPRMEVDSRGVQRLALQPEGWNTWRWRGQDINWLSAGDSGPVVLLIHGFGASVYHWRYVVPELSKTCRVFALDCLGFGWSSKALVDYDGYTVWSDQVADFVREVVGGGEKVVVAGNSLGGYNALAAAARHPDLFRGVVLLNAAGRFEDAATAAAPAAETPAVEAAPGVLGTLGAQLAAGVKRAVIAASFYYTKNPLRIRQVLGQVYVNKTNIDDDLVQSIALPAASSRDAPEVFYRVITANGTPMNRLLDRLGGAMPLLLLWGDKDPWCVPARATQIQAHYPRAERVDLDSGHCPHDDTPQEVNRELQRWVSALP